MTGRNAMIHRTTLQRDNSLGANIVRDEWGQPIEPDFATTEDGKEISVRYWYNVSDTQFNGEQRIVRTEHFVMLPIDTDINTNDHCVDIRDRKGFVMVKGVFRVEELGQHEMDHKIAKLVSIN